MNNVLMFASASSTVVSSLCSLRSGRPSGVVGVSFSSSISFLNVFNTRMLERLGGSSVRVPLAFPGRGLPFPECCWFLPNSALALNLKQSLVACHNFLQYVHDRFRLKRLVSFCGVKELLIGSRYSTLFRE